MADFMTFTGDRNKKDELSAANFIRRLNILFRAQATTADKDKLAEVADRFEDESPADKWFTALVADPANPAAASNWDAFCVAFKDRFKGAAAILKPQGQLEAELSRMRIGMDALAGGVVVVRDKEVYVVADFADRVRDAVTEAGAGGKNVGLWDFYEHLPAVLQEGVGGAVPATWNAMTTALSNIPQTKIDTAAARYREQKALEQRFGDLQRHVENLRISPPTTRSAPAAAPTPTNAHATVAPTPAAATPGAQNAGAPAQRPRPTDAQKEQLRSVLRECVRRTNPDTVEGRAQYARDIASWTQRYGRIARADLQLEVMGYPLSPGIPAPCTGECWRCGIATNPPHQKNAAGCGRAALPALENALRALGGSWLGRTNLQPPAPVNIVEVDAVPWYEGLNHPQVQAEDAGADFPEGLQQ
ncbi:hypothetical protein B0H11DRAFT_554006 [Mycena galericulata]|nr:hypothetical protein B0H11DRAFT_554006 [Mycena galericulata]